MEKIADNLPDLTSIAKARTSPDIFHYARTKFPEISDELIQQNVCELIDVQDAERKCGDCCLGLGMCRELLNTDGYTYKMTLLPSGWIKIEHTPCEFNGGRKIQEIIAAKATVYKQLELGGKK